HPLPLFGSENDQGFWLECIVGHSAAHHDVVARLNVRHRDRFAAFAQRSFFIQLNRLRNVVWPENGQLGRINRFHFAKDVVLAKHACWPSASSSSTGTAATVCATASRSAAKSGRACAYHVGGPGVIGVF